MALMLLIEGDFHTMYTAASGDCESQSETASGERQERTLVRLAACRCLGDKPLLASRGATMGTWGTKGDSMKPLATVVDLAPSLMHGIPARLARTPAEFLKESDEADAGKLLATLLDAAARNRSNEILEAALFVKGTFGTDERSLDPLLALAGEHWHDHHEEIAMGLAQCRSDRAVPILASWITTLPEPLEEGDGNSLPLKAAHALVTIGTKAAFTALREVRSSDDEVREIIDYALDSRNVTLPEQR